MTAEVENLIREHLRRIRGTVDVIREEGGDLKLRMSAIENNFGQMQIQMGQMQVQYAGLATRMDRHDERLSRIERRLELAEA